MHLVLGIAILLVIIGVAVWAGTRGGPTDGNGDNASAARQYGGGFHGG